LSKSYGTIIDELAELAIRALSGPKAAIAKQGVACYPDPFYSRITRRRALGIDLFRDENCFAAAGQLSM
jgi:hypothetical protein